MIPDSLYYFLLDGVPQGTTVMLRRGIKSEPGTFERILRAILRDYAVHLEVRWCLPDPDGGPGAAFLRDNEMVSASDLVLAFFAPYHAMEGGTGHVVETAIDRNVPVYCFTVGGESLNRVGDHDPDAIWQATIKEWFEGDPE